MFLRVFIANMSAERAAEIGQRLGMSGTVFTGFGFGAWGIERTVVTEIGGTTREEVARYVAAIFEAAPAEEAVYVSHGDVGEVWYRDGRVE